MRRNLAISTIFFCLLIGDVQAASDVSQRISPPTAKMQAVVLATDGIGDFGPQTPGTRTDGWQEAIDYCALHQRDLYVKGRGVFRTRSTIHVPASQGFSIDGGGYVLHWDGSPNEDMLVVDSGMDCHYTFSELVYGGRGAALRVKPEHPVPIDNAVVFVDSRIKVSSVADPEPFKPGPRKGGAGVIFDTSSGPIVHASFDFNAILNFAKCLVTADSGYLFAYNQIRCTQLHSNATNSTLMVVGEHSQQNQVELGMGVDSGVTGVRGVDIFGSNNNLELVTRGGFSAGGDLVFEGPASGNQVNIVASSNADVMGMITDNAVEPTNQITNAGSPPRLRTIPVKAGAFTYTQRLYPASVSIVGGKLDKITLVRGKTSVDRTRSRGDVLMSVGDQLVFTSSKPTQIQVVPVKIR